MIRKIKNGGFVRGGGNWHGRSDSNARHLVLETSALPTELHPFLFAIANIVISFSQPRKNKSSDIKNCPIQSFFRPEIG